jgi:hypothetical protein
MTPAAGQGVYYAVVVFKQIEHSLPKKTAILKLCRCATTVPFVHFLRACWQAAGVAPSSRLSKIVDLGTQADRRKQGSFSVSPWGCIVPRVHPIMD